MDAEQSAGESDLVMGESTEPRRLTRRTVAKGAAWAVPAVAVVSPTRAMAASPGTVTFTGQNCKLPGNSSPFNNGAVYLATITNTTNLQISIEIMSFTRGDEVQTDEIGVVKLSTSPAGACCSNLTPGTNNTFTVPANSAGTYAFITAEWTNSANTIVSVEYEVDGLAQPPAPGGGTGLNPIAGSGCGNGGSCTALTADQKECVTTAIGDCQSGDCS